LNSQVHNPGGGPVGGDQCAPSNFAMPWRDTFCETRSADRGSFNCVSRRIHQGVDIRAGTPALCNQERRKPSRDMTAIPIVAVADGFISNVGRFSVDLRAGGRVFRYVHLDPATVTVATGDRVTRGQQIGYLSNAFGGSPTTMHLHFEIRQNMEGVGFTWVSPYMSLVDAYARRERGRAQVIPQAR
jgi:murein DD-endopeptidase MepM/ murein hydrolase activator NlpD